MLSTAAIHERVYGRREDAAKPTCMSARALARLAVPRKLTSTVLVFQANNTWSKHMHILDHHNHDAQA